ncbi:MAG: hypothetical protein A2Y63_04170 [Candidatus Riflebacteria bacterium RBG_13_59_9]|nr:MAG: hypothetical protein A2Y63_04170 [Candidatus Riflebacteria bacterium RBG_13_59_9]
MRYTLSARNSHPEGVEWVELKLARDAFVLVSDRSQFAATLEFALPAIDEQYFGELDPENPLALFSEVKLACEVATENETLFHGFVTEIQEEGATLRVFARDLALKLSRTVCEAEVEGDTTEEIGSAQLVPLTEEFDDHTYGFDPILTPTGFGAGGKRRAWKPGDIRVYASGEELSPDFYRVYPLSGVVKFLDPLPTSLTAKKVRCYLEGTSDAAEAITEALQCSQEKGGVGAQSSELALPDLGTDLHRIAWRRSSGKTVDFLEAVRSRLPRNYRFYYNSDQGKFTHCLLEQEQTASRSLINVSSLVRRRSRGPVYTRVVVRGVRTNPPNLALNAVVTDLQAGVGEKYEWDGNNKNFGQGSIGLITDGENNHGFGRHNAPYAYQFYDFAKLDLGLDEDGLPPRVSAIEIVASNSKNVNSQKSANTKFSYGYEILGSNDDILYERVSPDAQFLLPPLAVARLASLTVQRMRYVKVRVKPAKDGVSNEDDPGLALNELRVFGDPEYIVEVTVQGDNPNGDFYYPQLLEKVANAGVQVLALDVGDELPETEALKLAREVLAESLYPYLSYEAECIADPTVRVGNTVSCAHPVTSDPGNFLVERVELTPTRTRVYGTDFNAEVLR